MNKTTTDRPPVPVSACCNAPVIKTGEEFEESCCDPTVGYHIGIHKCTRCQKNHCAIIFPDKPINKPPATPMTDALERKIVLQWRKIPERQTEAVLHQMRKLETELKQTQKQRDDMLELLSYWKEQTQLCHKVIAAVDPIHRLFNGSKFWRATLNPIEGNRWDIVAKKVLEK